jgi:DNA modification methylase
MQDDGWVLRSPIIWQRPAPMPEPTAHDRPWRTYEHVFLFSKSPKYWFDRAALNGDEDIWRISARPYNPGAHFAPYPIELAERCIKSGAPVGGTVLDPFVGSGTTLLTALALGRSAIGIDLKREYCDFIRKQIASGPESSLFGD